MLYHVNNETDERSERAKVEENGEIFECHDSQKSATGQVAALGIIE
jgi:hypothetical protein